MKKAAIFLIIAALMLPVHVFPSESLSVVNVFDVQSKMVSVSGNGTGTIIVRIIEDGFDEANLSAENRPVDIIAAQGNGEYSASLRIAKDSYAKRLKTIATDAKGAKAEGYFVYPDLDNAQSVVTGLDACSKLSDFSLLADANAATLGIDKLDGLYVSDSSDIYKTLFSLYPKAGSFESFYENYSRSYALVKMDGANQSNIENTLKAYAAVLGIDYSRNYAEDARLSEKIKKELCKRLSNEDFIKALKNETDFASYLEKEKALAAVLSAEKWQDIERVIEKDYPSLFSLDSGATSSQSVYSKMMSMSYNAFSDIAANYKKALSDITEDKKGGSTSGNKSGGIASGVTVSSNIEIVLPDEKEQDTEQTETSADSATKKPMLLIPQQADRANFGDVSEEHWCSDALAALKALGVVNGYENNMFYPENSITRAEFTKLVVNAFGIAGGKAQFSDVSQQSWYNTYVGAAAAWGIVNGYDGMFSPENYITRQDAVLICYNALKKEGIVLNGMPDFKDSSEISMYAYTAAGAFEEYGIIKGDGENVRPQSTITRAEAAQLIYKTLSVGGQMINQRG